jgi:putative hydrolase of the HAD superfamily
MSTVVVFDLDDTLYPESAFVRSALAGAGRHAKETWGAAGIEEESLRLFDAGRRQNIFQAAHAAAGYGPLDDVRAKELLEVYRRHRPTTLPWFPDARVALEKLHGSHALELISDGYLPTQANKFSALGAGLWIPNPLFTESLGRENWKPSPRAFELVMTRHPGARFVYVADNPRKDFIAPRALGWGTIRVKRPEGVYRDAVSPAGGHPDVQLDSLAGLPNLI